MMTIGPESTLAKTSAPTTEESATTEPTERSIPRVRMTSSWPSERTAMAAVAAMMLPRFRVVRKNGDRTDSTATRPSRMSNGPMRSRRIPIRAPL